MERPISVEERIKRAEEIYNRRNENTYVRNITQTPKEKKANKKKLITHICLCLTIYMIFYAISHRDHIFSEEFRNEVFVFFSEKTEICKWYEKSKKFILEKIGFYEKEEIEPKNDKEEINNNEIENTTDSEETIGKTKEKQNVHDILEKEEEKKIEQNENKNEEEKMKKDIEEIQSKISFIKPVEGRISSTFGLRNPTTQTVPKYHTGIDIAANEGTIIKSSTDGKIVLASCDGDYGNHYKIEKDNITIIYAHCKKLYCKEGVDVKQGQEIAEVGNTGNSTGPHLHFEIRIDEEKIDPQLLINF